MVLAAVAALAVVSGVLVGLKASPGSLFNLAGGQECQQQQPPEQGGEEQAPPQQGGDQQAPPEQGGEEQAPPEQGGDQQAPPEQGGEEQAPPEQGGEQQAPPEQGGEQQQPPAQGGEQQQPPAQGEDQAEPRYEHNSVAVRHLPSERERSAQQRRPVRNPQPPANQDGEQQAPPEQGGDQQAPPEQGGDQQAPPEQGGDQQAPPEQGGEEQGGEEQQPPAEEEQPPAECEDQEQEEEEGEEEEEVEPRDAEAGDFVNIEDVEPNVQAPEVGQGGSAGTFVAECGTGAFFNNDNFIVSPGVDNGAEHFHRAVGNESNDQNASDQTLAAGDSTCENPEEQSTIFWPLLRNPQGETPAEIDGAAEGNTGANIEASSVKLEWRGNAASQVVAMPRFIRVLTGFAKAVSDQEGAAANARATFSCVGFEDRITDKYPICPDGAEVLRISDFPGCWDGQNTDSANHRTHTAFADPESGACPEGFVAIPQLRVTATYQTDNQPQSFELDTFPTEFAKPQTDHNDYVNAASDALMQQMVNCINAGEDCVNQGTRTAARKAAAQKRAQARAAKRSTSTKRSHWPRRR